MIKSFKDFAGATFFEDSVQEKDIDIKALREETKSFDVSGVQEMILEYFGLEVEEQIIKKVIYNDLDLASEVYNRYFEDTCVRDRFIDSILQQFDLPGWPMNKDSAAYRIEFYQRLAEICSKENSGISKLNFTS